MTGTPDEARSWPEGAEAEEAVEALKTGLKRLHGHLADFRQQIGASGADDHQDEQG